MKLIFTLLAGLLILNAPDAFGQIGGLDTTFGQGGKVETYINDVSAAYAEALQIDGKIVVTGYTYDSSKNVFATVRYNTDGSVDTTFGVEGIDTISFQNGNNNATAIAIQDNGKIIVAGYSAQRISKGDSVVKSIIIRYNTDGTIDSTFGINGKTIDSIGTDNRIYAMAIQHDGKIVVTGGAIINYRKDSLVVVRYDSTGVLDTSFNFTGIDTLNIGSTAVGNAMVIQPNGKIVVAGTADVGGYNNFVLVKYNINGTLDNNFNDSGIVITPRAYGLSATSVVLQSDGKILVGGNCSFNHNYYEFAIARYDTSGVLDASFGTTNPVLTDVGSLNNSINSLAIDTNGKIIAAGFSYDLISKLFDFTLLRYDSNGMSLDTIFGDSGTTITGFGGADSYGQSVLIQPDGKIVVAGYALVGTKGLFALARYNIDTITLSSVDLIAENNSLLVYPNPVHSDAVLKYTLTKDETLTIRVYDLTGRIVQSVITNENEPAGTYMEMLNLEALPAGTYIVNLTDHNSQSLSIKLIKQ